jgi:hypothetical protein
MDPTALPAALKPAPPSVPPKRRITAKVKAAVDLMVWQGLKRDQAAEQAGLKDNSLYVALARPDVRSYYLGQLEVLRTSERARNIHTLAEVRDQTGNQMARVNAVKALEQLEDQPQSGRGAQASPGFVIQIVNAPGSATALTAHQGGNDAKPLITQEPISATE